MQSDFFLQAAKLFFCLVYFFDTESAALLDYDHNMLPAIRSRNETRFFFPQDLLRVGAALSLLLWEIRLPFMQKHPFGRSKETMSMPTCTERFLWPLPLTTHCPHMVEASFAGADVLAVEADPGRSLNEDVQHKLVQSALYSPDDSVGQHLSKQTYALAADEMQRLGYSMEQFARSKPWFLAMTINVLELQLLGFSPDGTNRYFADKALGTKKTAELEPFADRISLLNSLNEREQELFLLYTDSGNGDSQGADRRIGAGMADRRRESDGRHSFRCAFRLPGSSTCLRQALHPVESRHGGQNRAAAAVGGELFYRYRSELISSARKASSNC